jgi:chromosome segregation ATPase
MRLSVRQEQVRQEVVSASNAQQIQELRSLVESMITVYGQDRQDFTQVITEQSTQIEALKKEVRDQKVVIRTLAGRVCEGDARNEQTMQALGIAQNALRELQGTVERLEDSLSERDVEVLEERRERARVTLENEAIRERLEEQAGTFAERVQVLTQRNQGLERNLEALRRAFTNLQSERAEALEREAVETERYRADLVQRYEEHSRRVNGFLLDLGRIEDLIIQKNAELRAIEATILSERARKPERECKKWTAAVATVISAGILPAVGVTSSVSDIDQPLRAAMDAQNRIRFQVLTLQNQKNTIENRINNLQGRIHALTVKIAQLDGVEDGEVMDGVVDGENFIYDEAVAPRQINRS